jgi:hypothetical protein
VAILETIQRPRSSHQAASPHPKSSGLHPRNFDYTYYSTSHERYLVSSQPHEQAAAYTMYGTRDSEGQRLIHEWLDGIPNIHPASMAPKNRQDAVNRLLQSLRLPASAALYNPLPTGHSIRVLSIHPPQPDSHLSYNSLSVRPIRDSRPFSALSYKWDRKKAASPILINGEPVVVMDTVQQFLLQQRQKAWYNDIFIDCLCINQDDSKELESQVQLMGEIYSNATTVYVWLGESVCCTDYSLGRARELRAQGSGPGSWIRTTIDHLFGFDYWTRTWIVQEFLLAKNVEILCGSESLDLEFIDKFLNDLLVDNTKKHNTEFISTRAYQLIHQKNQRRHRPLAKVLIDNRRTAYTDIRDKVYGLLGLCSDVTIGHSFPVNYSPQNTAKCLFFDVIAFCDVHPDSIMGFSHHLRDSLRLTEGFSNWNMSPVRPVIHARAWIVGVIDAPGKPASDRILESFRISHAITEILEMEPASEKRAFQEFLVEAALWSTRKLEHIDPPLQINETRMCCHNEMRILGAPEVMRFDVLENYFNTTSNRSLVSLSVSNSRNIQEYTCLDFVCKQHNSETASYISALSSAAIEPGDIICQFLGLDTSFIVRKHEDVYLFIGKAHLEDQFHTYFWEGHSWRISFENPRKKPLVPKTLDSTLFVMDFPTLLDLCC